MRLKKPSSNSLLVSRMLMRISAVILAILALAVIFAVIVNIRSEIAYNEATHKLVENVKSVNKLDLDLHMLKIQQQQTDAQFDDANSNSDFLLPHIKKNIERNAAISRAFTKQLTNRINQEEAMNKSDKNSVDQNKINTSNNPKSDSTNKSGKSNSDPSNGNKPELNSAQKNKVEDLLKQNNHSNHQYENYDNDSKSNKNIDLNKSKGSISKSDNPNKPW